MIHDIWQMLGDRYTIFDAPAARAARDEAIGRVREHADPDWKAGAKAAIERITRTVKYFSADDIWQMLGDRYTMPHEPRVMGSMLIDAAKAGLCRATDRTVKSKRKINHGRLIRVWESKVIP